MSMGATQTRLAVLLFSDVVGSTELKSKLGTPRYAQILERHNALFESSCARFAGAEILKHTGDGYFASFATASDAVRFALVFQAGLRRDGDQNHQMRARVGIHIGEVAIVEMVGKRDVIGLAADLASRVMTLASGGQVLMTREAFNDARQFVSEHPMLDGEPTMKIRWVAHGPYVLQGIDEPIDVFEVGAENFAPLAPPHNITAARRAVPHDAEQTLGWRPALGMAVPQRPGWALERKLGEGGFGEVWQGVHERTHQRRVFKFCFDAERLRSFKRELTLFRLLRDALGDRHDIARLYEVKLDEPPFFIESEYTAGGSLVDWSQRQGGIEKVPMSQRLEIVAKTTDAVAAAHSIGILHKDVKPSNVLIEVEQDGRISPRLSDFGIGMLADRARLAANAITESGLADLTENDSSRTGTRLYAPPEVLVGKPFTIQGDVYALGVLLYQLAVGDLDRPLGSGWERDVGDELLREDIAACVDVDPSRRLSSAAELATRLRALDTRRVSRAREIGERRSIERRRHLRAVSAAVLGILVLMLATCAAFLLRERDLRRRAQLAEQEARRSADRADGEAAKQAAVNQFLQNMLAAADPRETSAGSPTKGRDITVFQVLNGALQELDQGSLADQPSIEAAVRETIGSSLESLGEYAAAEKQFRAALALNGRAYGAASAAAATSLYELGMVLYLEGQMSEAEQALRQSLELRRATGGADRRPVAQVLNSLAGLLMMQGRDADAEPLMREVVEVFRGADGESQSVAAGLSNLGLALQNQHKLAEAEPVYREAVAMLRKLLGNEHPDVAIAINNLASLLRDNNKPAEAEPLLREALGMQRKLLGDSHPDVATCLNSLAETLRVQGRAAEAEPLLREAEAIDRKSLGNDHPKLAATLTNLALALSDENKLSDAESAIREAVRISEASLGPQNRLTVKRQAILDQITARRSK